MRRAAWGAAWGAALLLTACTEMDVEEFRGRAPLFLPEVFFAGRTEGWGLMQDRFGRVRKQFRIAAEGRWDATTRTLSLGETYRFDDGTSDTLAWTIERLAPGHYRGTEATLSGFAEGRQAGNAFRWRYRRRAAATGDVTLAFDDWFLLQEGGVVTVRASVRRLGIEVATMTVFYVRR